MIKKIIRYYSEGIPPRKNFPAGFPGLLLYIKNIFNEMPPGISRVLKLQPVIAFGSGFAVIFLLKRGFEYIPIITVFIIFTFVYLAFKIYLMKNSSAIPAKLADITVMFSVNYMLLFILPFYFESMTFPSRNIVFGLIIAGLAVISNWYYLFEKLILNSIFASSVYYALIFFCVLNFIFPVIFGMRNIWSLVISGSIAAVTALMFLYHHIRIKKDLKAAAKFTSGLVLSLALVWFGRSFIPPAPLKLISAIACEGIEEYRPVLPFTINSIENVNEAYFFSSIFAPKGLKEKIDHVWYFNGKKLLSIHLSEISGGRNYGFGTWSKHTIMEGPGIYTVEIWTSGGQFLGEGSFVLR
ncbi:MAG: DUF5924 family protein [Spirochaetota bacterium]